MNDTLGNAVQAIEGEGADAAGNVGDVTCTIKVLSEEKRDGKVVRTVLFSRASDGGIIEIRAEIDTPNLLAAMEAIASVVDRMLAGERETPPGRGVLRLVGVVYRGRRPEALAAGPRAGAPVRRDRGWRLGRGAPPRR